MKSTTEVIIFSGYKLKYFIHTPTTGLESQVLYMRSLLFQWQCVIFIQSECSTEATLVELVEQMFNCSHQIVALIGLGCFISTEAIAKISQHYNIIQVNKKKCLCYEVFDV